MSGADSRDVVIRSQLTTGGTQFVVYAAGGRSPLGGPFSTLSDAVSWALSRTPRPSDLFYEALDEFGRSISSPMRLRTEEV